MVLGNWDDGGLAVNSASGGENQAGDAVAEHGVEKEDATSDVGGVEGTGIPHGLFDKGLTSKMHDGVNSMAAEDFVEPCRIAEIGFVKGGLWRNSGAGAFVEIIQDHDIDAGAGEKLRAYAADVASTAGN